MAQIFSIIGQTWNTSWTMDIVRCKPNFDLNYRWQHKMLAVVSVHKFMSCQHAEPSWAMVIIDLHKEKL